MTNHQRHRSLSILFATVFGLLGVTIAAMRFHPLLTHGDETRVAGVLAGGMGLCLLFFGRTAVKVTGWLFAIWGGLYLAAFVFVVAVSAKTLLIGCAWTVWGVSLIRREPGSRSFGWAATGFLQAGFTPIGVLLCALQAVFIVRLREAAAAKRIGVAERPRRILAA